MKKINNLFICLLVCSLLYSCAQNEKKFENENPTKVLVIKRDTLKMFQINDTIKSINHYYQPYESENFYFLDTYTSKLWKINTENLSLNQVCIISPFTMHDIFVVDEEKNSVLVYGYDTLLFFDLDGRLIKKIGLTDKAKEGYLTNLSSRFVPVVQGEYLFIHYFPKVVSEIEPYRSPEFYTKPIEAKLSLTSGKVELINQTYPFNNQQRCFGFNYSPERIVVTSGIHGYTFPYNDSLFVYDIEANKSNKYFFGTHRKKSVNGIPFEVLSFMNSNVFQSLYINTPFYSFSGSAPLAGYFYRSYLYKNDSLSSKVNNSLILLDKKFNYAGESDSSFQAGIIIDSKKGLLMLNKSDNIIYLSKLKW